mgnify:FL=1
MTNDIDFDGVGYFCEALQTNQVKDVIHIDLFIMVNYRHS